MCRQGRIQRNGKSVVYRRVVDGVTDHRQGVAAQGRPDYNFVPVLWRKDKPAEFIYKCHKQALMANIKDHLRLIAETIIDFKKSSIPQKNIQSNPNPMSSSEEVNSRT